MFSSHLGNMETCEIATIQEVKAEPGLTQRLYALGFRVGNQVQIIRKAWFNGPLHIRIGTTELMLRRQDAINIIVADIQKGAN